MKLELTEDEYHRIHDDVLQIMVDIGGISMFLEEVKHKGVFERRVNTIIAKNNDIYDIMEFSVDEELIYLS